MGDDDEEGDDMTGWLRYDSNPEEKAKDPNGRAESERRRRK